MYAFVSFYFILFALIHIIIYLFILFICLMIVADCEDYVGWDVAY